MSFIKFSQFLKDDQNYGGRKKLNSSKHALSNDDDDNDRSNVISFLINVDRTLDEIQDKILANALYKVDDLDKTSSSIQTIYNKPNTLLLRNSINNSSHFIPSRNNLLLELNDNYENRKMEVIDYQ